MFSCSNDLTYSHTGQPLHEVGKGEGDSSGYNTENNSRTKGVGKKKGKKGNNEPWMEAQISRKKPKTSEILYFINKFNYLMNYYCCV